MNPFTLYRVLWVAMACLIGSPARAGVPELACGSPAGAGGGHAWLIRGGPPGPTLIWHLPPRSAGATHGRAKIVSETKGMPAACAALGSRLYLIFDDKPAVPPARPRQVLTMSAVPTGEPGRWTIRPSGRMETAPSIRADGRILSATGAAGGVWVLLHGLRDDGADPSRLALLRLGDDGWSEVPAPEEAQRLSASATIIEGARVSMPLSWTLFAAPRGVGLMVMEPEGRSLPGGGTAAVAWLTDESSRDGSFSWRSNMIEPPFAGELGAVLVCGTGGRLIAGRPEKDNVYSVRSRDLNTEDGTWTTLTDLRAVTGECSIAPLDADGLAAIFHYGTDEDRAARMIAEVSARTGRIMYQGRIIGIAPAAPSDVRLLTFLMGLVIGSVVLFITRPPGEQQAVHLPARMSLAGPVRRGIAALIDAAIGLFAAAGVWRVPWAGLLTPEWWGASESWIVCGTALSLLVCGCTLCEALMGKTVGKVLCGCEVITIRSADIDGPARPPSMGAALLRNLLKWCVPLIAVVGTLDASRRHRADEWAGCAVVEPIIEDDPTEHM